MEQQEIIQKTANYMKEKLAKDSSGHDWWHTYRVWQLGKKIANLEKADLYVVELASLLHDIADYKLHNGDEEIGPRLAGEWLQSLSVKPEVISHVPEIISNMSFKPNRKSEMRTIEGKCVQDADWLDAIGAIGIARCFAFGGYKGNIMYDPSIKPNPDLTEEQYKKAKSTQINHFYEKLLLIKDRLNTKTAKKLAEPKHDFIKKFLEQFLNEWNLKI